VAKKKGKSIVLCIDRDDDIGRKTDMKGPVIGWDDNIEAAQKLALSDPEDSDVNAIYGALKLARTMGIDVVTLTGSNPPTEESDRQVAKQLDDIIEEFNPRSVMVVSDGVDDEQLLPIIQSRIKIDAVRTIVVRQSKELEKAYFKFTNFIKEISEEPDLARLLFGLPGLALLLLALGGVQALSLIIGVTGLYLLIKASGKEEGFFEGAANFFKALSVERIETVIYLIAFISFVISLAYTYGELRRFPIELNLDNMDLTLNTISVFILNSSSLTYLMISFLVLVFGRIFDFYSTQKYVSIRRYLVLLAFIVLIRDLIDGGANFIVNEEYGIGNFILRGTVGIVLFGVWIKITEMLFITEIGAIRKLIQDLSDRDVYTSDGRHLGKVTQVLVDGMELSSLKVGRMKINGKDIVSMENEVIVNANVK